MDAVLREAKGNDLPDQPPYYLRVRIIHIEADELGCLGTSKNRYGELILQVLSEHPIGQRQGLLGGFVFGQIGLF